MAESTVASRATPIPLEQYRAMVGKEIGVSDWTAIEQPEITAFADLTGDHQSIHVDPEAAARSPFGGTIAHGFLVLSMLSGWMVAAVPPIEGRKMGLNYGMNNLRFLAPVRSGRRVRAHFTLLQTVERSPGQWQSTIGVSVEIEGETKPALAVEWMLLYFIG